MVLAEANHKEKLFQEEIGNLRSQVKEVSPVCVDRLLEFADLCSNLNLNHAPSNSYRLL